MRVNTYRLLSECIARGLEMGWNRAHKHTDKPHKDHVLEQQDIAIMGEVCDYFEFGLPPDVDRVALPQGDGDGR